MTRVIPILAVVLVALGTGLLWLSVEDEAGMETSIAVAEALEADTAGYARADAVREFQFPADHGPHPDYKTEWWYVTGNLDAEGGRSFGYQFTIFRVALTPADTGGAEPVPAGRWHTNQLYMGHLGLSDIARERHSHSERFSRGAAGLAGAQAQPFRVWLEDWALEGPSGAEPFPMRIRGSTEAGSYDLTLTPLKPKVFQGERGLSQKGPAPGNASYYYSYTRLHTKGSLVLDGDTLEVEGLSWMDREWSTSALGEDQVGWDWLSLQLDDGRDVMYYQIRNRDATPSRFSKGTVVDEEGTAEAVERAEVDLTVQQEWESPRGGVYPAGWRLQIPAQELDLHIRPYFPDQEMDVSVRYWEGAVQVEGFSRGEPVQGRGFVELTGYGDTEGGPVS